MELLLGSVTNFCCVFCSTSLSMAGPTQVCVEKREDGAPLQLDNAVLCCRTCQNLRRGEYSFEEFCQLRAAERH